MAITNERISLRIKELNLTYDEVAKQCGFAKSTIFRYATGERENIPSSKLKVLANVLRTNVSFLLGISDSSSVSYNDTSTLPDNITPAQFVKRPRLGVISCGNPILSEENFEGYDDVPSIFSACDFTLKCEGDSMTGARINDGDLVFIKQQQKIENGEIAAVLIDGSETLLKRIYITEESIVLQAENPKYPPRSFFKEDMNRVGIIGKAIGFASVIK